MATYCGINGKVLIGTTELAEGRDFTLEVSNDVIMTPAFQQSGKVKKVCGPYDWKGTMNCYWDMTAVLSQKVLHDAVINGTTVSVKLYIDDTKYYSGSIFIPAQSITHNSDGGVAEVSFTYEGSGDLALTGV